MRKLFCTYIFLSAFIFHYENASAIARVSNVAAGNWNTAGSWLPIGVPAAGDDVTIQAGQSITLNAPGGSCNNLIISGMLTYPGANTLAVGGNLTMNAGSAAIGTVNGGIMNVSGTFLAAAGGNEQIGRITLSVALTSTINGTLLITQNTSGTKTFTGNATFNNGSAITYNVSETLDFSGSVSFNGTGTISGTTTGILNMGSCSVATGDRKSTRLNYSHGYISYAVFCLTKKNNAEKQRVELQNSYILKIKTRLTTKQ